MPTTELELLERLCDPFATFEEAEQGVVFDDAEDGGDDAPPYGNLTAATRINTQQHDAPETR